MKTIVIDKTIKNIKKNSKTLKKILTAKISEKKILCKVFGGDIYSKNSSTKNFFFVFPVHKRVRYKKWI